MRPRSRERHQRLSPSTMKLAAVASGSRQMPAASDGLETRISPTSPGGTSSAGRASRHDHAQVAVEQRPADADQPVADHFLGGDAAAGGTGLGRAVHLHDIRADLFAQALQGRRIHRFGGKADQAHGAEIRALLVGIQKPAPERGREENMGRAFFGDALHQIAEVEMLHEDGAGAGVEKRKPAVVATDEGGAQRHHASGRAATGPDRGKDWCAHSR